MSWVRAVWLGWFCFGAQFKVSGLGLLHGKVLGLNARPFISYLVLSSSELKLRISLQHGATVWGLGMALCNFPKPPNP